MKTHKPIKQIQFIKRFFLLSHIWFCFISTCSTGRQRKNSPYFYFNLQHQPKLNQKQISFVKKVKKKKQCFLSNDSCMRLTNCIPVINGLYTLNIEEVESIMQCSFILFFFLHYLQPNFGYIPVYKYDHKKFCDVLEVTELLYVK